MITWLYDYINVGEETTNPYKNILNKSHWLSHPGGRNYCPALSEHRLDLGTHFQRDGEGNGNPLQYSCLENPKDGGAWWATVHGVAELDTIEWLHLPKRRGVEGESSAETWQTCNQLIKADISSGKTHCCHVYPDERGRKGTSPVWCLLQNPKSEPTVHYENNSTETQLEGPSNILGQFHSRLSRP